MCLDADRLSSFTKIEKRVSEVQEGDKGGG